MFTWDQTGTVLDQISFCLHGTVWNRNRCLHGTSPEQFQRDRKLQKSSSSFASILTHSGPVPEWLSINRMLLYSHFETRSIWNRSHVNVA